MAGRAAGRELEQRLCGLAGQTLGEHEKRLLVRLANVVEPFDRDAVAQQLAVGEAGEQWRLLRRRHLRLDVHGTTTSSTVSSTSTSCAAPVFGCVIRRRRCAHAYALSWWSA